MYETEHLDMEQEQEQEQEVKTPAYITNITQARIPLTSKQQETVKAIQRAIAEVEAIAADKLRGLRQTLDIMMDTILEERGSQPNAIYDLTPDGTALYIKELKQPAA